jgi:hypothetical protein
MDSLKNIEFAKKFDIKTFGFKLKNNYHQIYSSMSFPSGNNSESLFFPPKSNQIKKI